MTISLVVVNLKILYLNLLFVFFLSLGPIANSKLYMDTLHIICIDNFTIETHEVVVVGLYI